MDTTTASAKFLTVTEREELSRLVNTATEGPWIWQDWGKDPMYPEASYVHLVLTAPPQAQSFMKDLRTPLFELYDGGPGDATEEDMALVQQARTLIPRLLTHIEEMEKLLSRAESWSDATYATRANIFVTGREGKAFREAIQAYRQETEK